MAKLWKAKMNEVTAIIESMIEENHDIVKLLYYCNDQDVNPYEQPLPPIPELVKLMDTRVLKYKKLFEDSESCAYIILRYGRKKYHEDTNMYFNGNTFDIWVLCHNGIVDNRQVGSIVNEIEECLIAMFDNVFLPKLTCRCTIYSTESVDVNRTDYSGRHIQLSFSDVN